MGRFILLSLALALCLMSCDQNRVYDRYQSLPGHWNRDSIITFKVSGLDSTQAYNLFINIRNTDAYPYSNLYLITKMKFPHGKVIQDTLQYMMAHPDGSWMGVGYGKVKTSKLWYKKKVHLREKGTYTLSIRQAMREKGEKEGIENLQGITEVGLRIEQPQQINLNESE